MPGLADSRLANSPGVAPSSWPLSKFRQMGSIDTTPKGRRACTQHRNHHTRPCGCPGPRDGLECGHSGVEDRAADRQAQDTRLPPTLIQESAGAPSSPT